MHFRCEYCRGAATPGLAHLLGRHKQVCKACLDALILADKTRKPIIRADSSLGSAMESMASEGQEDSSVIGIDRLQRRRVA